MPIAWTLPETPNAFREWLGACPADTVMGMAGGYRDHPIVYWFTSCRHEVFLSCPRQTQCVYLLDQRTGNKVKVSRDHWIARFCRALMIPDSYRTVTAAECLAVLDRLPTKHRG